MAEHLREEVLVLLDIILSLVWDVLSKVLGSYLYDKFFKKKKYQASLILYQPANRIRQPVMAQRNPAQFVTLRGVFVCVS